jgi:signal transduction histidine kinase
MLLGLLAVTAGMILTAILQLRRELRLQQLRSEFVASVSHELRTPLAQIRLFTETLLLDRVRSPQERQRSLEIIDREARRLNHLVDNVLRFARSEREPGTVTLHERELAPLISEVPEAFEPLIAGTEVVVERRLGPGIRAAVDADCARQILLNLLDNALKYGPPQQRVVVGTEAVDGRTRMFVEDEGPGIPARDRERVFERFRRLERDRRSARAGAGIGLAVVRELAELQGGRCFVETGARGGARLVVEWSRAAGS